MLPSPSAPPPRGERILLLLPKDAPWELAAEGALQAAHALAYPHLIERHETWNPRIEAGAPWNGAITALWDESWGARLTRLCPDGAVINLSNARGPVSGIGNLLNDDHEAGRMAAGHLLARGYRSFLVLGMARAVHARERTDGFLAALARAGHEARVIEDSFRGGTDGADYEHYLASAENFLVPHLNTLPMDAGIFATNDWIARLAQNTILHHFPERLHTTGILGVDNSRPSFYRGQVPALSSVEPDFSALGRAAMEWLLMRPRKPETAAGLRRRMPPLRVVERASTMGAVGTDPLTAQMARWAWEKVSSGEWVSVAELAEHHHVSRKTVTRRFAEHAGLPPEEFLARLRLDRTKDLLKNTDLPISEISHRCGFAKQDVLSRAMTRAEGCSPREWREAERKKNLPSPEPG